MNKHLLSKLRSRGVLIQLELTVAAVDAGIHRKTLGSGATGTYDLGTSTLITSNKKMEDILKILSSLEDSQILRKGVTNNWKWNERTKGCISCYVIRCKFVGQYDGR